VLGIRQRRTAPSLAGDRRGILILIHVRKSLEEQHPRDIVLVIAGVDAAMQDIGALSQMGLQLLLGQGGHRFRSSGIGLSRIIPVVSLAATTG
jgi:hypothetical protein